MISEYIYEVQPIAYAVEYYDYFAQYMIWKF